MGIFSKYEQLNKGVQKGLFLTDVGENHVQEEKISTINKRVVPNKAMYLGRKQECLLGTSEYS